MTPARLAVELGWIACGTDGLDPEQLWDTTMNADNRTLHRGPGPAVRGTGYFKACRCPLTEAGREVRATSLAG